MNSFTRVLKLLHISDKELFVLGGDIDTYLYFLFLRNIIYLLAILVTLNCGVLMPLYYTGDVSNLCNNA